MLPVFWTLYMYRVYSITVSKNLKDWTNAKGQKRAYWRCKHFCPPSQNIGGLWLISLWSSRCYQHPLLLSVKIHFWKEFGTSHEYIFPLFISLLVGRWSFLLVVRNWHVHCPAYWYVPWKHTCSAAMFWIWKILTLARPSSSIKKEPCSRHWCMCNPSSFNDAKWFTVMLAALWVHRSALS